MCFVNSMSFLIGIFLHWCHRTWEQCTGGVIMLWTQCLRCLNMSKRYTIWRPGRHPLAIQLVKARKSNRESVWAMASRWVYLGPNFGLQWANNISARWLPETASQAWDPLPLRSRPFPLDFALFAKVMVFSPSQIRMVVAWESWIIRGPKMGRLSAEWPLMWGKMMTDQWIQRSFRIHLPSFEVSDLPSMTKPERNLAEGQGNIPAHHHFGHVHYSVVI